ncbi:MAG: mismatch repair protein MutL [Haloplasmataceae bacterium]|jgi:DNA mismatch repair protein MutL|nr:mismatch repair protein MutL [Haloplasmataceae bacterium]
MAQIQIMSSSLANKIAAGEVVERPASVVKELVENSIDAQSTKIDIYLEESGIQSIKIIDNGNGMDDKDAILAFERHATSKLLNEQDLFRIMSLGFRGEALPSIASVSDVHLVTSKGDVGTYVNFRGGKLVKKELSHARRGTEITVNSLFFNTPARLKYLKAVNTELSYTIDFINKIALSHPQIAFKLVNNNRALLQTNGNNNLINVLSSLYGVDIAKKIKVIDYEDPYFKFKLHYSEPEINRTTRNYITLIVNDRMVKNNELTKAILEGYETYLPINRYPVVVLNLTVDPLLVDVNVHPAKLEIRLSNLEHLKTVITDIIHKKLKELLYVPKVIFNTPEVKEEVVENQQEFDFLKLDIKEEKSEYSHSFKNELNAKPNDVNRPLYYQENSFKKEVYTNNEADPIPINETDPIVEIKQKIPKLYYIGQLAGTYLLAQNNDGLYLIDQHAAQERVNYEYYLKKFSQRTNEVYDLLIPLTFEFSLNEAINIEENINNLLHINLNVEKFGLNSFIVTQVPNWFKKGNEKMIIEDIFSYVLANKKVDNSILFNDLAITLSCKRSIKANHYINEFEVKQLLFDLEQCDNPYTCPHGRPVIIHMSIAEIEHLFKRTL